jgi:hypothetical protein
LNRIIEAISLEQFIQYGVHGAQINEEDGPIPYSPGKVVRTIYCYAFQDENRFVERRFKGTTKAADITRLLQRYPEEDNAPQSSGFSIS